MQIPVCHITRFGNICGHIVYDTSSLKFLDKTGVVQRQLPYQSLMDCTIENPDGVCTLVGRNALRNTYAVCFGDNFIYELRRDALRHVSNPGVDENLLPDLSHLFPNDLEFVSGCQHASNGVARKFRARYKSQDCIVKFTKLSELELDFEVLYKRVCDLFDVSCCGAVKTSYNRKACVVSLFDYNVGRDTFRSFRQCGSVEKVYNSFTVRDKNMFNTYTVIDYLLSQQDRHMSNLAVVNGGLYPLYDNGECLGLGAVGSFSNQFRQYTQTQGVDWIRHVFRWESRRDEFLSMIPVDRKQLVISNIRSLGL